MKKNVYLLAFMLSVFTLTGCDSCCKQETCTTTMSTNNKSVNGFDENSSSPYYNQVVANFNFTQTTTNYTAPNDCSTCPSTAYSTTLQITNATSKTMSFGYSISFSLNLVSWNYQNVATISPNGTISVGQISNSGASISLGQIVIQSTNITYQ